MGRSCGYGVASLVAAACPTVRGAALQWGADLESWGAALRALPGGDPMVRADPVPSAARGLCVFPSCQVVTLHPCVRASLNRSPLSQKRMGGKKIGPYYRGCGFESCHLCG